MCTPGEPSRKRHSTSELRLRSAHRLRSLTTASVNGVELYCELAGTGEPLVLVHGSWGDHHNWDPVIAGLAESFRVLAYDRRGHSASERPDGQGSVFEDADDLVALIETMDLSPAHVAGNSFGAAIALRAAARRPDVFRTLIAHEPPLFPLLAGTQLEQALDEVGRRIGAVVELLERGEDDAGAELFVNTIAFGPGAWDDQLTSEMRDVFAANAPTFLDETRDPDALQMPLESLAGFDKPALLTSGTTSAPFFGPVVDIVAERLPACRRVTVDGADHVPHISMPERYVELVRSFVAEAGLD
jgi:pimeloyl-ACP methyl ester carboxylesterase